MPRKEKKWLVDTTSGPHSSENGIPLSASLRENLDVARNRREADKIVNDGKVEVDGKVRRKPKYPIGPMDIIRILETGQAWRILHDESGYLQFHEISEKETEYKLEKVVGKHPFKGGRIQLSFHDGKTIVGDFEDINIDDTVKVGLPDMEVLEHIECKEGNLALITGGTNVGKVGKIKEIVRGEGRSSDRYLVETDDEELQSPEQYIFIIGEEAPAVSLPGGD